MLKEEQEQEQENNPDLIISRTREHSLDSQQLIPKQSQKVININLGRKALSFAAVSGTYAIDYYINVRFVASLGDEALVATYFIETTLNLMIGAYFALEQPVAILTSNYHGDMKENIKSGNEIANSTLAGKIGDVVQAGWFLGSLACIPIAITLWNIEPILVGLGQQLTESNLVQQYMHYYVFCLPFRFINGVNTNLIAATDREYALIPYNLIILGVSIPTGYLLTFGKFGLPVKGIAGFGIANITSQIAGFVALNSYFICNPSIQAYHLYQLRRSSLNYIKDFLKLSSPLILYSTALGGTSFVISLMVGNLGTLNASVMQTTEQYMSLVQIPATAISSASAVYVAQLFGARLFTEAKRYGTTALIMGSICFTLPLIAFLTAPMPLTRFYIGDEANDIETLVRINFALSVLTNYCAYLKRITSWNLASIHQVFLPTVISLASDLAITLPMAYCLSYLAGLELTGINLGILSGSMIATSLLGNKWARDSVLTRLTLIYQQVNQREQAREASNTSSELSSYLNQCGSYFTSCYSAVRNRFGFFNPSYTIIDEQNEPRQSTSYWARCCSGINSVIRLSSNRESVGRSSSDAEAAIGLGRARLLS